MDDARSSSENGDRTRAGEADRVGEVVERHAPVPSEGEARAIEQAAASAGVACERMGTEWQITSGGDDRIVGVVRPVAGDYEARVYRHPTGPSPGPDPELAHGPQVFDAASEAVDYVRQRLANAS